MARSPVQPQPRRRAVAELFEGDDPTVITPEQRAEVERTLREAGLDGRIEVAPVLSEDERVFVVPADSGLVAHRDTEAALQNVLRRKAWIVERSDAWPLTEPLH